MQNLNEIKEYKFKYKIITKPKICNKDGSFILKIYNRQLHLIVSNDEEINAYNGLVWLCPHDADLDQIKAEYENKTLYIIMPKKNYIKEVDIKRK